MASFSVPCPKISASFGTLQPNSKQTQLQRHSSISFRSDSKSNRALLAGSSLDNSAILGFQASSQNQYEALRVSSQLNEVAIENSKNSVPVPKTKSEESTKESASLNTIPDASSISAFMNQVADLVELVDSRDIVELQLKQLDCEVLIRKKEALPQPPVTAPYVMMQSHSPQAGAPSQLPPAQAAAASTGPVVSSPVLAAPPIIAKPKSSHPPLKCPMAGTFYRCPAPGAPPFVKVGDKVQKGQVICIIEAMKLMNEIEADHSGTVVDILVEDGKPVSVDLDDENALLQQALAMSMDNSVATVAMRDTDMSEAAADDQDLELALQLSVEEGAKDQSSQTDMSNLLADQSFVSSVLASVSLQNCHFFFCVVANSNNYRPPIHLCMRDDGEHPPSKNCDLK